MQHSTVPYLAVLRTQLATGLRSGDHDAARQAGLYSHRILTQLLLREQVLPTLRATAVDRLAALFEPLAAVLSKVDGGTALIAPLDQHLRRDPDYGRAEPVVQMAVRLLGAKQYPEAAGVLCEVAAILRALHDSYHEMAFAQDMPPAAAGTDGDEPLSSPQKASLGNYLRGKFDDPTLEVGTTKAVLGGGSKQTVFVDLRGSVRLPSSIVLRVDKATSPVGSSVADEFDIVKAMFEAEMPVPRPFALDDRGEAIGAAMMIVSKVDGTNIGDALDVFEPSRDFGISLARALAKMHNIPPDRAPARLPGLHQSTIERVANDIAEFEGKWRALEEPLIALELAYGWLKSHLDFCEGRRSIIHRDVGCHNMLAKDGYLACLLDWETAAIGNPAQDLAYTYHTVVQIMPWEEFLAEYARAGGTIPSEREIDFYRVWRAVWLMGFQLLARDYFLSGKTSELILAYASQYWYQRCEQNLHEMVDMVHARYRDEARQKWFRLKGI